MVIPDSLTTTGYFYNTITPAMLQIFAQLGPKGQLSLKSCHKTWTLCLLCYPPTPAHHKLLEGSQTMQEAKIWYVGCTFTAQLYRNLDVQPPSPKWSLTFHGMVSHHPNLPEGGVLQYWICHIDSPNSNQDQVTTAIDGQHHPKDGQPQPPSKIPNSKFRVGLLI